MTQVAHDDTMPHDIRGSTDDIEGCPPNCPARLAAVASGPRVAGPGTCKQVGCEGWGTVDEHVRTKIGAPDTFAPYKVPHVPEGRIYIAPASAERIADLIVQTATEQVLPASVDYESFALGVQTATKILREIGEACR